MTGLRVRGGLALAGVLALAAGASTSASAQEGAAVTLGSKNFTEGVVLGELLRTLAASSGAGAEHRESLGGTRLVFNALVAGEIDAYAEYTGTLRFEIFQEDAPADAAALRVLLSEVGVTMSAPLGFENNYALGVTRELAAERDLRQVSDLASHPGLVFRFSSEFVDRGDGWPGLRAAYGLPQSDVLGIEHDLAYRGLAAGDVDLTELYTTDAEIAHYDLAVLEDDRGYFPRYAAVLLYRTALEQEAPEALAAMLRLEGQIDEEQMIAMNARAKLERVQAPVVAADFVSDQLGIEVHATATTRLERLAGRTLEHMALVGASLFSALLIAVPLGVLAARRRRLGQAILALVGVAQTIPALALLVFMIPLFGIGAGPALFALFLYSLLPIVRNTHAGLTGIALPLLESAEVLGLPPAARLRRIELPLAAPSILAGIKTAAVINVGAATLGALIGAGGYGQPILTGIRLDDTGLILEGAVPAAVLAVLVQWLLEWAERAVVPRGLRASTRS